MIRDTAAQDRPLEPPPAWRRRLPIALVLAAALAAVAFALPSVRRLAAAERSVSAERLVIAAVERGEFVRDVSAEGKVVAAFAPTVYAPHAGAVELKVQAGRAVRKGDLLAVVSSPELASKLAQEQSNADALRADHLRAEVEARQKRAGLQSAADNARIDLATAENELARQRKAFEAGAVPGQQVDRAGDALEKARIALAHARAGLGLTEDSLRLDVQAKRLAYERQALQVAELRRQVGALQVRSPVDGQVGQLFVAERASVAADAPLLSVVDLSQLEVQMQVPETAARDLGLGMAGEIRGAGGAWAGAVSAISPEVVQGQVAARLRFTGEAPRELRQNQRLTVRVILDRRPGVLMLRRGAFVDESGGAHAYVVRADDVAEKVPVRLGARSTSHVEVLGGLKEGDRVVISGADAFADAPRVALAR